MSARSRDGLVKRSSAVVRQKVDKGKATELQVLIGPDEAPHFAMRKFIMGEGGGMPRHTNEVEHEQYVLSGRARIGLGDRVVEVGEGDVVFIPARQPHEYEVLEAPFEFLCVVPNQTDEIRIIEGAPEESTE